MNWNQIEPNWGQLKRSAKLRWSKLGEEQLSAIAGRRAMLASRIRETYQLSAEETETQIIAWQDTLVLR